MDKKGRKSKEWSIGDLWRGKHLPEAMKRKESRTKRKKFRLGLTKPTWLNRHHSEKTKQKISRTKLKLYRQGKIKPPWKNKKPPFYRYWLGKKRSRKTMKKIKETKRIRFALGLIHGSNKNRKLSKEWRKHMSEAKIRLYAEKPEIKQMIRKKMIERYKNHPRLRKKISIEKQKYYETHPEARKNLLKYGMHPERKVKAMHNLTVKSEGEKKIANLLYKNHIQPNYESVELNFPEMDPVPDFFPKGSFAGKRIGNILIEFYGGFPKAWKTKVKKNILYKKYHVPVMIITPAELREENHDNLLREMVRLSGSPIAGGFKLEKWRLERKDGKRARGKS